MPCLMHARRPFGSLRSVDRSHRAQLLRLFQRTTIGIFGSHFRQTALLGSLGVWREPNVVQFRVFGGKVYPKKTTCSDPEKRHVVGKEGSSMV